MAIGCYLKMWNLIAFLIFSIFCCVFFMSAVSLSPSVFYSFLHIPSYTFSLSPSLSHYVELVYIFTVIFPTNRSPTTFYLKEGFPALVMGEQHWPEYAGWGKNCQESSWGVNYIIETLSLKIIYSFPLTLTIKI